MITQQQQQKQQLKISAQQIQLLNFYALNSLELEGRIKNELTENPFLEAKETADNDDAGELTSPNDVQDYQDWDEYGYDDLSSTSYEYQNYFGSDQLPQKPLAYNADFKEEVKQQLGLLSIDESQREIAEYIIDVLNDRGLLDRELEDIAEEISFKKQAFIETEDVEAALMVVQSLDPIGLGARGIRECLEMQLCRLDLENPDIQLAYTLIKNHYNELLSRQFERITHALKIDNEKLREILAVIGKLKFHPVSDAVSMYESSNIIIPDFIITANGDTIHVSLLSSKSNSLYINQVAYEQASSAGKQAGQFVRNKLHAAEWLIDAIKQREDKMLRIMKCIISFQHEYFKEGDIMKLKPMVLRNVAEMTGLDMSTISRITSEKYAETHFGFVYLKDLFSEGIADKDGKIISNKVIQSIIEETISREDKRRPYTDQQLLEILFEKGYKIARRTVTKYREMLNIPIAQIRSVLT